MARHEDKDEDRLRDLSNRMASQDRLLLNRQEPIKKEIARLNKKWETLQDQRENLRKLKVVLVASHTKFDKARAHASQVGVEITNLDTDLTLFEGSDE